MIGVVCWRKQGDEEREQEFMNEGMTFKIRWRFIQRLREYHTE